LNRLPENKLTTNCLWKIFLEAWLEIVKLLFANDTVTGNYTQQEKKEYFVFFIAKAATKNPVNLKKPFKIPGL
jgi:hypothetical protein